MLGKAALALALAIAGSCPRREAAPPGAAPLPPPAAVASHDGAAPGLSAPAPTAPETAPPRVDFATQVQPILEARCQPCHFAGGKMYAELPFDQPLTILMLGTRLFTRIKDEEERRVITAFLEEEAPRP